MSVGLTGPFGPASRRVGTRIHSEPGTVLPLVDQTEMNKETSALIYGRPKLESHVQSLLIAPFPTGSSVRWKAISLSP